jgi:hypothetical protein
LGTDIGALLDCGAPLRAGRHLSALQDDVAGEQGAAHLDLQIGDAGAVGIALQEPAGEVQLAVNSREAVRADEAKRLVTRCAVGVDIIPTKSILSRSMWRR